MSTSQDPKENDTNAVVTGRPGGPKKQDNVFDDGTELQNDGELNLLQLETTDEAEQ